LEEIIPEDFYQECALFLAGWTPEAVDADPKSFWRRAGHHFYQVAVNYGFRRPKRSSRYIRQAERLEPPGAEDTGYDPGGDSWLGYNPGPQIEDSLEFGERLELCKRILLSGNGTGKTDWYLFQGYLSGLNLNELAFLTLGEVDPKEVKKRLREIIRQVREAAGVNPNLPLPPFPKNGEVKFLQGGLVNAGSAPRPLKPRKFVGDPRALANLSLKEIMKEFGVSEATACRIRKRGWFCPDYRQIEPNSIKGLAQKLGKHPQTIVYHRKKEVKK
jgi:hypothetical protein